MAIGPHGHGAGESLGESPGPSSPQSMNGRASARPPRARRLRVGELLALAGAVCVIVSLFLPWYQNSVGKLSAWETFGPAVALLIAAAAAALALFVSALTERSPALPVAIGVWSTLLALAAVIAAVVRVLERPQDATRLCAGTWVALAGALAMLVGSWQAMRDERTSLYRPPSPPRRPPPGALTSVHVRARPWLAGEASRSDRRLAQAGLRRAARKH